MDRSDLVPVEGQKITFSSNTVYKVVPLQIGGYLVFDIDTITYCHEDLKKKFLI
jgi:hypothetical protein